jgi:hypothetical protein
VAHVETGSGRVEAGEDNSGCGVGRGGVLAEGRPSNMQVAE